MHRRAVLLFTATALVLSLTAHGASGRRLPSQDTTTSPSGKPLVKRPEGSRFKTILAIDGGGTRTIVPTMVIIEIERSIKRHLLNNSVYLPSGANITSVDDFDIHLADFFDCIAGVSAGTWPAMYLASRGAKGAARAVLDDPAIVEKYGFVPDGGAEAMRVFFREYSAVVYPPGEINLTAGTPFDVSNPLAPGVLTPLFKLDGIQDALGAFFGNATLADVDTALIVPAFDLLSAKTALFVKNTFGDEPYVASGKLISRAEPRPPPEKGVRFRPDLTFDQGKDYYLADIGVGCAITPAVHPAKSVSQAGNDTTEFSLIDGILPIENAGLFSSLYVASETGAHNFEDLAVISLGNGLGEIDFAPSANAGVAGWLGNFTLISLYNTAGQRSIVSLLDYIFYSNPRTKPYQFLRIQVSAPAATELGMLLSQATNPILVEAQEAVGVDLALRYRESIDIFVRDFIFADV